MEDLLFIILQFFFELLVDGFIDVICELLTEGYERKTRKYRTQNRSPAAQALIYIMLGAICGAVSLVILPHPFIISPGYKLFYLFASPAVAGGIMVAIGKLRQKKGQELVSINNFAYAYIFAFSLSLVRYVWTS